MQMAAEVHYIVMSDRSTIKHGFGAEEEGGAGPTLPEPIEAAMI